MDKKKKIQVVILVTALFLCGILYLVLGPGRAQADSSGEDVFVAGGGRADDAETAEDSNERDGAVVPENENPGLTYIYICGAVKKPGVYTFDHNPRIVEVVEQAGGFTKRADTTSVNLAGQLEDGAQVVVYEKNKDGGPSGNPAISDGAGDNGSGMDASRVNINTAGLEDLKTIPGIGDSKAAAIVSYREENGRFQKIEDIMNISGIKQGIFDRIKDYITV